MIAVLNKTNNRFTGSYSIIGGVSTPHTAPSLPPCSDPIEQLFWRYESHRVEMEPNIIPLFKEVQATDPETGALLFEEDGTTPIMTTVPDIDEETGEQKTKVEQVFKDITEWFQTDEDKEDYAAYLEELENAEKPEDTATVINGLLERIDEMDMTIAM